MVLFLLDKCAACSKDLAFNAPRCVRCWVRYCDSTCQQKLFSDNLRKSTRLHGSNHPTTAKLAYQLKSAHKLIAAMRLRDRARRSN